MVSVRRVAPILLLAVTIPVWAVPQAATKTDTATAATSKKTTTKKSPAKKSAKAPASTTSAAPAPAPTPAPVKTPAPATKKAAKKRAPKKSTAEPAATTASKRAPKSTTRPPKNLHKVGDHWTAYNPPDPATYPANAKTYAIKQGDTLWGLATQFYNNGYMWPQIWETNTWITDAHWIYPGDVLLIEGEISQHAEAGGTTGTGAAGTTGAGGTSTTGGTGGAGGNPLGAQTVRPLVTAADAVGGSAGPIPLATEADIYCYGYIGDPNEPMPNQIFAWEDGELRYSPGAIFSTTDGAEGDLAFITGGSSTGLVAGETYMLVAPRGLVPHPKHKYEVIGREYDYIGQVKVLCADGQQARGIITKSCVEIPLGARLKPMPQLPIPLARIPSLPAFCDPQSGKTRGYIVSALGGDWFQAMGEGYLVQINLGRDDQVQPGEFLTVFRPGIQPGTPPQILGEIAVLTAENHTATAKIVLMRYNMMVGDEVEIR